MKKVTDSDVVRYIKLLKSREEWLICRILEYAKKHGFTKYTSMLQETWRSSIQGISESLIKGATSFKKAIPELHPDEKYINDPVLAFELLEARKHRERGVPLSMYIGLMKYYKQTYIDLIEKSEFDKATKNYFRLFTERCFDRIEIAYITEWSSNTEENLLDELQSTNRNLTNEKNKYHTIFESFYSPLIILDDDNRVVNFNFAAFQYFADIQIAGELYYQSNKSSKAFGIINQRLDDFIKSSLSELAFETYLNTDKGQKFFLVKLKKMFDVCEKFRGTVLILDDLTERKEMERQLEAAKLKAEEADQLKTAFLANMSHEIRTPMNAIIGFSDLLINDAIKEKERKEYLKLIQKSGNNLLKIIDDIIDVAKIESKQLKVRPTECKLSEIFNELSSIFQNAIHKINKPNIELIQNIDDSENDLVIKTDAGRLKQVFNNLISNAIKFTDKGYIEFGYKQLDEKHVYFFVRDTGIGIPQEKQEEIFKRFVQVEDNYTKDYGGTGLGLTITKNIVNLLGGDIWVNSEIGKGSTFYFFLPSQFEKESTLDKPKIKFSIPNKKVSLKNHTILIAEDEETNFLYLHEILKRNGAKIIWGKNGLETINLIEANSNIDLVLMDIKMPEINGLEAIKYIKAIRPDLPIIAQTAFVMDDDKELCIRAGCVDFISKPIKGNKLIEIINKYLVSNYHTA